MRQLGKTTVYFETKFSRRNYLGKVYKYTKVGKDR